MELAVARRGLAEWIDPPTFPVRGSGRMGEPPNPLRSQGLRQMPVCRAPMPRSRTRNCTRPPSHEVDHQHEYTGTSWPQLAGGGTPGGPDGGEDPRREG
jgi:hypothetical protein